MDLGDPGFAHPLLSRPLTLLLDALQILVHLQTLLRLFVLAVDEQHSAKIRLGSGQILL